MTQTVSNTEPTAQEAPETAIDDLSQFNSGNTYDPAGNSELDDVRVKLNSRPLDDRWVSAIRAAAGKKHFPLELQFEVADMSKAVTFTLGELAATAEHERAIQYIYPKRVDHVLFGPHGIARGHKLSNDIQLAWRRRLDGELEPYPCITSGRHRLTAIIMLLQHLGIRWETQRIMVSTKVVSDETEFAQLIFDNNDSRKMNQAEKRNHKLGALGINTASEEAFYTSTDSVRRARTNVCPQAFAAACRFNAADKPQAFQDRLYTYAAGAYSKLVNMKENRAFMRSLVRGTDPEHKDLEALKKAALFVSDNLLTGIAKGRELFPQAYEYHAAPKGLAIMLADHLKIEAPDFTETK